MALIESAKKGAGLLIDALFGAARVTGYPLDYTVNSHGGHFQLSARSGAITGAGVVAGAPLFSLRWGSADRELVLLQLEAFLVPTVVFTAAQELGLDLMRVRDFKVADSVGTAIDLTEKTNVASRKDMNESEIADARIAAATLLTAGTRTLDKNAIISGSGLVNDVNAAAGTAYVNAGVFFGFNYQPQIINGEHPLVLRRNEGVIVRNTVGFPAAGAAVLTVNMRWVERAAYGV